MCGQLPRMMSVESASVGAEDYKNEKKSVGVWLEGIILTSSLLISERG